MAPGAKTPDTPYGRHDPWPGPNHHDSDSDWQGYDLEQLAARIAAVYSAAFDAYAHLVHTWLPKLATTLELVVLLPVRMEAYVDVDRYGPGISFELWPQPSNTANQFVVRTGEPPPQPWDETKTRHRHFAAEVDRYRPDGAAWVHGFGTDAVLEIFGDRPATELAFKWLWQDLYELHLVNNIVPKFSN